VLNVIVSSFGDFTAAHGFAVNLFAVLVLAGLGAVFCASALRGDARLARIGVIAGAVFCVADWVLVEDLGFLGGVGTDPNSMIPLILLFTSGYLALTPAPRPQAVTQPEAAAQAEAATAPAGAAGTADPARNPVPADSPIPVRLAALRDSVAALSGRSVAALGAVGVILVGAAPMAFASANRNADPIVAEAIAGASAPIDEPAPDFTLTSQAGRQVALSSLRGKVVLLTFLDPVCTTDCPIIGQEMRSADTLLGAKASKTELVAVVANPTYTTTAFTEAFTRQEGFGQVPNWLYLTGSLSQLQAVWQRYGIEVQNLPGGAMSAHNDLAFVISASGQIRQEISTDPGPATQTSKSSFSVLLANAVRQTMDGGQ
jgi:cytochrome oxidase Cu insertion factor (SCO1/SenC/PrrC family)